MSRGGERGIICSGDFVCTPHNTERVDSGSTTSGYSNKVLPEATCD